MDLLTAMVMLGAQGEHQSCEVVCRKPTTLLEVEPGLCQQLYDTAMFRAVGHCGRKRVVVDRVAELAKVGYSVEITQYDPSPYSTQEVHCQVCGKLHRVFGPGLR